MSTPRHADGHLHMDLVRPCAHCPFRSDIPPYLTSRRVIGIAQDIEHGYFVCHETVDYDSWDEEENVDDPEREEADPPVYHGGGQHCAGLLIMLEKLEQPTQLMRIFERFGGYNPEKLDMDAPVHGSWDDMARAQDRKGRAS